MTEAEIRKELIALITDKVGIRPEDVLPEADIEKDLGCTGDDFFELMDAYAKRFKVDMSGSPNSASVHARAALGHIQS